MKLKVFTIIELITTLIISSITIAFAVSVLTIVVKMHNSYKVRTSKIGAIEQFNFLINKDIFESKYLETLNNGFSCVKDSIEIKYYHSSSYITRHQMLKIDTFHFKNTELTLIPLEGNTQYIEELDFNFTIEGNDLELKFYKDYDAYTKMLERLMVNSSPRREFTTFKI